MRSFVGDFCYTWPLFVSEKNDLSGLDLALVRLLFFVIIFVLLERTVEIKLFNIQLFIGNFGRNIRTSLFRIL